MNDLNNISTEKTVIFTMGAAGAGKSTVIKNSNIDLPTVDCDQFKAQHPEYDPKIPQAVHAWSKVEAKKYMFSLLSKDESFILDGTGRDASRMIRDIQTVQGLGYRAVVVYVKVKLATSLERNAKRERTVPEEVVREQHELIPLSYQIVSDYADQMITINND